MACSKHNWFFDTPCANCEREAGALAAAVTKIGPDHDKFEPSPASGEDVDAPATREDTVPLGPTVDNGAAEGDDGSTVPPCAPVSGTDQLEIPPFLKRSVIYRDDNNAWVEMAGEKKPGDEFTWAGHRVRVVEIKGALRYKELSYTPPERRGAPKEEPQS